MMNIYYTIESPRNKELDKYPYFKHVIKPQDEIVGYYALKKDYKYIVLRKFFDTAIPLVMKNGIVESTINKSIKTCNGKTTSKTV